MGEHFLFYCVGIFRHFDIKKNGKVDINGVLRAPCESILHSIEVFVDCILIGFVTRRLIELDPEEIHRDSLTNYWVLIDCCLLIMMHGFTFICSQIKTKGEIAKNIYTISFVQERLTNQDLNIKPKTEREERNQFFDDNVESEDEKEKELPQTESESKGLAITPGREEFGIMKGMLDEENKQAELNLI